MYNIIIMLNYIIHLFRGVFNTEKVFNTYIIYIYIYIYIYTYYIYILYSYIINNNNKCTSIDCKLSSGYHCSPFLSSASKIPRKLHEIIDTHITERFHPPNDSNRQSSRQRRNKEKSDVVRVHSK